MGLMRVINLKKRGIAYIGNINPESIIDGIKKRKVESIACCCVCDIVEIYNPTPRVQIM
jgi:hypothetical protein